MKRYKGACLILIAMLWTACTDQIVYHSYHHIPKEGWGKRDTIALDLHITDSVTGVAGVTFLVRNDSDYPYQDFSVMLLHNVPDSTHWKSIKLKFVLADKEGRWNGAGWAGLYKSEIVLGKIYIRPGTYTFKAVHQMSDEYLKGINDIGILIETSKPPASRGINTQKDEKKDGKSPER